MVIHIGTMCITTGKILTQLCYIQKQLGGGLSHIDN